MAAEDPEHFSAEVAGALTLAVTPSPFKVLTPFLAETKVGAAFVRGGAAAGKAPGLGELLDDASAAARLREGALLAESKGVSFKRSIGMSAKEAVGADLVQVADDAFVARKARVAVGEARATYGTPVLDSEGAITGVGRTFWVSKSTVASGPEAIGRALAHEAWERRMMNRLIVGNQNAGHPITTGTWNEWVLGDRRTPHGRALQYEERIFGAKE
jgi:hypothetical protein